MIASAPALYTSTSYTPAAGVRRRVALRQIVADPVAKPAARLREALDWYADEDNHVRQEDVAGVLWTPVVDDDGQRARKALDAFYELGPLFASNERNDAALGEVEDALDFYADWRSFRDEYGDGSAWGDVGPALAIRALVALDRLVDEGARYHEED